MLYNLIVFLKGTKVPNTSTILLSVASRLFGTLHNIYCRDSSLESVQQLLRRSNQEPSFAELRTNIHYGYLYNIRRLIVACRHVHVVCACTCLLSPDIREDAWICNQFILLSYICSKIQTYAHTTTEILRFVSDVSVLYIVFFP